jgi:hypothetical protein
MKAVLSKDEQIKARKRAAWTQRTSKTKGLLGLVGVVEPSNDFEPQAVGLQNARVLPSNFSAILAL